MWVVGPIASEVPNLMSLQLTLLKIGGKLSLKLRADSAASPRKSAYGEFSGKSTIIPLGHLTLRVGLFVACALDGVVYKDVGKQLIFSDDRNTYKLLEQAMTALQQSEHIFELVKHGVMTRSMEGQIEYWSQSAEDLYGWRKEEAIGRISHDLLRTQFPRPLKEIESELVRNGRWEGKLMHTTRDGDRVLVASWWTLDVNGRSGSIVEINARSAEPEARTDTDSVEIGRHGAFSGSIVAKLAIIRFRLRLAIYDSEFVRSSLHISQRVKNLVRVTVKNPRRVIQKILGKSSQANRIEIREPSPAETAIKAPPPSSSLPIIFIHWSNSDYLKYSFAQARTTNPRSNIFLLSDFSDQSVDCVEHLSLFAYCREAEEFKHVYKHYSTNGFNYELINFQRWFVLKEFLIVNKLQRCLYLDSDTMLYGDVTKDSKKFEHFDFTLSQMTSGCTFFLNRVEALTNFCNFLFDIYTRRDRYHHDKMVGHFTARRMNRLDGGVCDMTAFQLYHELNFGNVGEASRIIDGSLYDPAITSPAPGFEMKNGIKRIIWKEGLPYGRHVRTGREIKFNSLQFQGRTKHLMSQYYTGNFANIDEASRIIDGSVNSSV